MTFIALDVGNTRLKWAMYADHSVAAPLLAQGAVFLENIDRLADEDWKTLPAATRMLGCIVAGDALRRRVDEQRTKSPLSRVDLVNAGIFMTERLFE